MEPPLELTWGFKLGCVVRYDRQRYSQYLASGDGIFWETDQSLDLDAKFNHLVRSDIIQALKLEKIPVHGILGTLSSSERFAKWTVWLDGSIIPTPKQLPPEWAGSSYTGIELKTPIFLYKENAFQQLIQVISILNKKFSIFVNYTCGLHVHIGNGNEDIPFSTARNLATLATAFERQLNSLHPYYRIHNKYCRPLGWQWNGLDPIQIATEIEKFGNIDHLVEKLSQVQGNPEKHHAINFLNLIGRDCTRTIEFRQHKATTNPTAIIQWVRLCYELIRYCYHAGEIGVLCFLWDRLYREDYTLIDLLTDLGLGGPDSSAEYYGQAALYEHPQLNSHTQGPSED
ncbi:MAG: hypothetical protein Q9171_005564 [Xanthocarpia ochracea]